MLQEINAKIASAYLGGWDNSVPIDKVVVGLTFSGGSWGQGSGYYSGEIETFIVQTLKTIEVPNWASLPGTVCRIRRENGRLIAVGHFLKD